MRTEEDMKRYEKEKFAGNDHVTQTASPLIQSNI